MSPVPTRMTAIVIRAPGGPDMLVPEERPVPPPGSPAFTARGRSICAYFLKN